MLMAMSTLPLRLLDLNLLLIGFVLLAHHVCPVQRVVLAGLDSRQHRQSHNTTQHAEGGNGQTEQNKYYLFIYLFIFFKREYDTNQNKCNQIFVK